MGKTREMHTKNKACIGKCGICTGKTWEMCRKYVGWGGDISFPCRLLLYICILQEVHRLAQQQPAPANLQQRQAELLTGAVTFMFRAHQFVTGLDAKTHAQFAELAVLLQQVNEGSFRPPAVAAASI